MSASLIIEFETPEGEIKQKSVSHVNQYGATTDLISFSQEFISLTNNTYKNTTLIIRNVLEDLQTITPISFTYDKKVNDSYIYTPVPDNGIINIPVSEVSASSSYNTLNIFWRLPTLYSAPEIKNIENSNESNPIYLTDVRYYETNNQTWITAFRTTSRLTTAQSVSFDFSVNGLGKYANFSKQITFNLTTQ